MKEESKIRLAKGIKLNSKLLLISLIIGLLSYPVISLFHGGFKAISLQNKFEHICEIRNENCDKVLRSISNLGAKYDTEEYYTSKFPIREIDNILAGGEADGEELLKTYRNMYYSSSKITQLDRFDDYVSLRMVSYNQTLENTKYRSFGKPAIIDSFTIFIALSFLTIFGRYIFLAIKKTINWTNKYSSKEIL